MTEDRTDANRLGYVLVTPSGPEDGGDFGPHTPGTRTAGIQEAIDAACASDRNVFISGVQGGGRFAYHTQETIHIPPRQGLRIDGGQYVLSFEGTSGDALCIDSCMDCCYRFGLITSRADGAVVRFAPRTPVPIDGMTILTDSVFEFSSVVGGGRFDLRLKRVVQRPHGAGILLDATRGSIVYNRIFAVAVLLCETGVALETASGSVAYNRLQVLHNHQNAVGLRMGTAETRPGAVAFNRIDLSLDAEDVPEAVGAIVAGRANVLTLDCARMAKGRDLVLTAGARDNVIHALSAPSGLTSLSPPANNRILAPGPAGFALATPALPASGAIATNRHHGPVEVLILAPGDASAWTLSDAAGTTQRVQAAPRVGERFLLEPGAGLGFEFTSPPVWRWRALP